MNKNCLNLIRLNKKSKIKKSYTKTIFHSVKTQRKIKLADLIILSHRIFNKRKLRSKRIVKTLPIEPLRNLPHQKGLKILEISRLISIIRFYISCSIEISKVFKQFRLLKREQVKTLKSKDNKKFKKEQNSKNRSRLIHKKK